MKYYYCKAPVMVIQLATDYFSQNNLAVNEENKAVNKEITIC